MSENMIKIEAKQTTSVEREEENVGEDDRALAEGREDVEDTAQSVKLGEQPETVVEFLRSYLSQMGMYETLDCFQTEWNEMVQKRLIDAKCVDVIPYVYIQNRHLEIELNNATRERKEYQLAAAEAAEAVVKVQKARDVHRMRHKRIIQEKNKVIEDIRKLTTQCSDYQPKVKQMNDKYQTLVKQTLELDKALDLAKQDKTSPLPVSKSKGK